MPISLHLTQALTLSTGLLLASIAGPAAADPLAGTQWKNRVVLVFAGQADDPKLAEQRAVFRRMGAEAHERDMKLVEVVGNTAQAAALRQRFDLPPTGFKALLIGKDGGSKLSSDEPLQARVLLPTIDAMPMRRDEMGRGAS